MARAGTNGTERGKTMPPARLLVADDHGLEVVAEAREGLAALDFCRELRPDLVLMDVSMPGMDGLEATREIKAHHPEVIVLMVTAFEDPEHLLEAIRAGVAGYVLKHDDRDRLIGAIRRTLGGESPLNQDVAMRLLGRLAREGRRQKQFPEPDSPLSPRELDALRLLAAGKTNRRIAGELYLSLSTLKGHPERIISATVRDDQANMAKSNTKLYVDGDRKTRFSYNASTDRLTHAGSMLSHGTHTVRARDEAGNRSARTWSFRVVR